MEAPVGGSYHIQRLQRSQERNQIAVFKRRVFLQNQEGSLHPRLQRPFHPLRRRSLQHPHVVVVRVYGSGWRVHQSLGGQIRERQDRGFRFQGRIQSEGAVDDCRQLGRLQELVRRRYQQEGVIVRRLERSLHCYFGDRWSGINGG
jgi:hypothetical protein